MFMFTASYVPPRSGVPTGRIFSRVLSAKGLTQKTVAMTMGGQHYEATLSKGIAGLGPLDLHALMTLDARVLWKLFRLLLHAKLAAEETELFSERKQA